MLLTYMAVILGGGIGAAARLAVSNFCDANYSGSFPLGTFIANVSGCLLIGFIATLSGGDGRELLGHHGRHFFMVGILGGYTTFSSFSLQTLTLAQRGDWLPAALNIILSVVLCLFGVWLGQLLAQTVNNWLSR